MMSQASPAILHSAPLVKAAAKSRGPRVLFFSGGSAFEAAARELTAYTHNGVYLVTPFDSGGSSATLRQAFGMPAVGDIRFRIMTLADQAKEGHTPVYRLFAHRLPEDAPQKDLCRELVRIIRGTHPLIKCVPEPMNEIIREHMAWFTLFMPVDFPLAGASLGNIAITAGYLRHGRRLTPSIALFSRMVRARGVVRPVVDSTAHLAVRLRNGRVIVGQHLFTGKNGKAIESPIDAIWLTENLDSDTPIELGLIDKTARLIRNADAICYPMGSFYSSIIANLLPNGVGRAVADCPSPKIFIPNLGHDPELLGHDLRAQIQRLLDTLLRDVPDADIRDVLTHIVVDTLNGQYDGPIPFEWLKELGVQVVDARLVTPEKGPMAQPGPVATEIMRITRKSLDN